MLFSSNQQNRVEQCPWGHVSRSLQDRIIACLRKLHGCRESPTGSNCRVEQSWSHLWRLPLSALWHLFDVVDWDAISRAELKSFLAKSPNTTTLNFRKNGTIAQTLFHAEEAQRRELQLGKVRAAPIPRNLTHVRCVVAGITLPSIWFKYADWTLFHCLAPVGVCGCQRPFSDVYCVKEFFMEWSGTDVEYFLKQCIRVPLVVKRPEEVTVSHRMLVLPIVSAVVLVLVLVKVSGKWLRAPSFMRRNRTPRATF